jgi:hypothetical protein
VQIEDVDVDPEKRCFSFFEGFFGGKVFFQVEHRPPLLGRPVRNYRSDSLRPDLYIFPNNEIWWPTKPEPNSAKFRD